MNTPHTHHNPRRAHHHSLGTHILGLSLALLGTIGTAQAQTTDSATRKPYIMASKDTVEVAGAAGFNTVSIKTNDTNYTIAKADGADWLSYRKEAYGDLTLFTTYHWDATAPRYTTLTLTTSDGTHSRTLVVKQQPNDAAADLGDTEIKIQSATASSTQSGYDIAKAIDGDLSTYWHSNWSSGGSFPFTVTLTLSQAQHVDYLKYTPRQDNSNNGNWGTVAIAYATNDTPNTFVDAGSANFGQSSSASTYDFGESGIDNIKKVRITISSAYSDNGGAFASAAEIGLYQKDQALNSEIGTLFTSSLCTQLRDGITEADINTVTTPYLRLLARTLLQGNYSTKYRVGQYGCYLTRSTLRNQLKVSAQYDKYENPTGIYFKEGSNVVVFAEGIDDNYPVQLQIANFSNADLIDSEGQSDSYYTLKNGANVITPTHRGNGYVSYYSDNYTTAPQVKLHFALADEVGYFDQAKGSTNDDWKQILANAKSVGADIIDVLSKRLHVAVPYANVSRVCPSDGERLAIIYDSIIYREREIMGLPQMDIEPTNHQFAKPVASGMFANDLGANAAFGSFDEWCNPSNFGFWGMGHELGHNNQITPGFKWSGLGETTNNIYSAWVEHKLGAANAFGNGYHRLEDEHSGIDTYSGWRGGRFEAYLEEGIRKGISWQLQDGPDYHGSEATESQVTGQDENGNSLGTVTATSRNYDHFLKVVPFWQLTLFTEECQKSPTTFGRLIQSYRDGFNTSTYNTGGKQQIEMMRRMCEASGYNLLPFFEKAGMCKPINALIEDYSKGWLIITESMISALKTEVEAKGYKEAPAALYFINAYNWQRFRDEVALTEGTVGNGCTLNSTQHYVKIDNEQWPGAVGYETYKADGTLLHLSMYGLGDDPMSGRYTLALFPTNASYVMAVGYDGTKVKVYQK